MKTMDKLKVGIIGAGAVVENSHLPVLEASDEFSVEWVADKVPERSRLMATMYGVSRVDEASVGEALDRIDICLLAVPYGARRPYIESCARAGKALYVEKPFARSESEHRDLMSMFPAHRLAVGFQRRFYRSAALLAKLVESRVLGGVRAIAYRQGHFQVKGGGGFQSDARLAGGGLVIESAIHALDQILVLTRASAVTVERCESIHRDGLDYDSLFHSVITTPSGPVPVTCEISCLRSFGTQLEIELDEASVRCDLSPAGALTVVGSGPAPRQAIEPQPPLEGAATVDGAFRQFWRSFAGSVAHSRPGPCLAGSSLLTTRWVEQFYVRMGAVA